MIGCARGLAATVGLVIALAVPGCRTISRTLGLEPAPRPPYVVEPRSIEVALPDGATAILGADLYRPDQVAGPTLIIVPGAGRVSRAGTRASDGASEYDFPIDVTVALLSHAAIRGWGGLAYDKRTCSPSDDERCAVNPTTDLDVEGPVAMARDVDAACALVEQEAGLGDGVVLVAQGQAAQVALSADCAARAKALVFIGPIPRRVDRVLVAALRARAKQHKRGSDDNLALRNRAGALQETFRAMRQGRFETGARVLGATVVFWQRWVELTDAVPGAKPAPAVPWIVMLGERDVQYAPADRKRIRAWGELPEVELLEVVGADHHLLEEGALGGETVDQLLDAVSGHLPPPSPEI